MLFPSDSLAGWCRRLRELRDGTFEGEEGHVDGFGESEIPRIMECVSPDDRREFANCLFWGVWIDQVMWRVLMGGHVEGDDDGHRLYHEFIRRYPFPKLYRQGGVGHASPALLLAPDHGYEVPGRRLLLEGLREFWGEVAAWLDSIHKPDVRQDVESAFREDIGARVPQELGYLFPTSTWQPWERKAFPVYVKVMRGMNQRATFRLFEEFVGAVKQGEAGLLELPRACAALAPDGDVNLSELLNYYAALAPLPPFRNWVSSAVELWWRQRG